MTEKEAGIRPWMVVYLKGVLMGAADVIPGVSGGTIALITGIYDRLVGAIAALHPALLWQLLRIHHAEGRADLRTALVDRDVPFILVLGAGVLTAVVTVAGIMHTLIVTAPGPMNALFFGLIGASAIVIYRHTAARSAQTAIAGLAGFLFAATVTGVATGPGLGHTLPVILVSGAVASAAMLLPGISGAAFLYILGQYSFMTGTLKRFVTGVPAVLTGGPFPRTEGFVIMIFLAGFLAGILTVAHTVRWALDRYHDATMAALIGLMVGALRMPLETIMASPPRSTVGASLLLSAAVLGVLIVLGIDRWTGAVSY